MEAVERHRFVGTKSPLQRADRAHTRRGTERDRFVADSALEERVWSEPVSEVGFSAPGNYGNSEAFMDDNRSGKGLFRARKRRSFSLCPLAASPVIWILNC